MMAAPSLSRLGLPGRSFDSVRAGAPQRSGAMTIVPLFGPDAGARFLPPLTGLKLSRVAGYGNVEIACRGDAPGGVAIVPLHIGYVQDRAQNHALCGSALIGAGQTRMFEDACCVQQAQGGYLEGRDQWFFVLPVPLREKALRLRGTRDFRKLWAAIADYNRRLGLAAHGHLEHLVCGQRWYLTQYASRFELCDGQTGALFFVRDRLVGIELAPNAAYFAEAWMPLVCFSYGPLAKELEPGSTTEARLDGASLAALRTSLAARRELRAARVLEALSDVAPPSEITEDERRLELRLSTVLGKDLCGQIVEAVDGRGARLVYLSLSATSRRLDEAA